MTQTSDRRLAEHVRRLEDEHPPISLGSVDFAVQRPELVRARYGNVLEYMATVELEVERNIIELGLLLPDPPEIDRYFYADVWLPQELRHGQILDEVQTRLGLAPAQPNVDSISLAIAVLGKATRVPGVESVARMLYYLTGMATERSALVAYQRLQAGLLELGETAMARTVVEPIRRQEPGHFAFYRMSASALAGKLTPWQLWLTRRLRRRSYRPVGAHDDSRMAKLGEVLTTLGIAGKLEQFATEVGRVERDLLWAQSQGLGAPRHILAGLRDAMEAFRHSPAMR